MPIHGTDIGLSINRINVVHRAHVVHLIKGPRIGLLQSFNTVHLEEIFIWPIHLRSCFFFGIVLHIGHTSNLATSTSAHGPSTGTTPSGMKPPYLLIHYYPAHRRSKVRNVQGIQGSIPTFRLNGSQLPVK